MRCDLLCPLWSDFRHRARVKTRGFGEFGRDQPFRRLLVQSRAWKNHESEVARAEETVVFVAVTDLIYKPREQCLVDGGIVRFTGWRWRSGGERGLAIAQTRGHSCDREAQLAMDVLPLAQPHIRDKILLAAFAQPGSRGRYRVHEAP